MSRFFTYPINFLGFPLLWLGHPLYLCLLPLLHTPSIPPFLVSSLLLFLLELSAYCCWHPVFPPVFLICLFLVVHISGFFLPFFYLKYFIPICLFTFVFMFFPAILLDFFGRSFLDFYFLKPLTIFSCFPLFLGLSLLFLCI